MLLPLRRMTTSFISQEEENNSKEKESFTFTQWRSTPFIINTMSITFFFHLEIFSLFFFVSDLKKYKNAIHDRYFSVLPSFSCRPPFLEVNRRRIATWYSCVNQIGEMIGIVGPRLLFYLIQLSYENERLTSSSFGAGIFVGSLSPV